MSMFKLKNNGTEFNFWPSIADTLLAIFMVFLMLWLAEKLIFLQQLGHVQAGNEELTQKFDNLAEECAKYELNLKIAKNIININKTDLEVATQRIKIIEAKKQNRILAWQKCEGEKQVYKQENARLSSDLANCKQDKNKTQYYLENCEKARYYSDKPPIITLSEGDTAKFSFPTGDAKLSSEFKATLLEKIDELVQIKKTYGVDVIEVIGHTDGEMTQRRNSNLDIELENAVADHDISNLHYGSNADLGLMRALAVAFFLQEQPQLSDVKFRVYSAAQLILPNGQLADTPARQQDKTRRRIELRFTHLGN